MFSFLKSPLPPGDQAAADLQAEYLLWRFRAGLEPTHAQEAMFRRCWRIAIAQSGFLWWNRGDPDA